MKAAAFPLFSDYSSQYLALNTQLYLVKASANITQSQSRGCVFSSLKARDKTRLELIVLTFT